MRHLSRDVIERIRAADPEVSAAIDAISNEQEGSMTVEEYHARLICAAAPPR